MRKDKQVTYRNGNSNQKIEQIPIEWGVASTTWSGQATDESGDQFLIQPFPKGVLIAVVDGLGHGDKAAQVAKKTVKVLETHAGASVVSLFKRCHQELLRTRGVVMSLASIDVQAKRMTWLAVGNVTGLLLRADIEANPARKSLLLRGGVVGYQLPPLQPQTLPINQGDVLIFATDGLRDDFKSALTDSMERALWRPSSNNHVSHSELVQAPPKETAQYLFDTYSSGKDDTLVLVTRYQDIDPEQ